MLDDKGTTSAIEVNEVSRNESPLPDGSPSPAMQEKGLVRRLDMRLMPVLCALYLFACTCVQALLRRIVMFTAVAFRPGQDQLGECPVARTASGRPTRGPDRHSLRLGELSLLFLLCEELLARGVHICA